MHDQTKTDGHDKLFFRDIVERYTEQTRFLQRDWLAEAVTAKLGENGMRCVLVVGAPGSGKSSFIAQLAADNPLALVYFLRVDQRRPLAEGSAKSFLVRIGLQFAANYPDLFEPDAVRLEVTQEGEEAGLTSQITGARIGRLVASPFFQKIVRVRQDIRAVKGRLIGLEIDEVVSDPQLLSISDLQTLALSAPAKILKKQNPHARIMILVDAVDQLTNRKAQLCC